MRKLLMILPIVGLLAFSAMLTAGATQGGCDTFENHSGHIPGSYDYAEFYEDGQLVVSVETDGEDIFVDPADYDAGEDWDQVNKCHTTTEPPTVTAECLTLTVDAAEDQIIGVQIGDGFVEIEGSDQFIGQAGESWAVYWNDQVLASGVFEECDTTTTSLGEESSTTTIPEITTTTSIGSSSTTTPVETTTVPTESTTTPELPFTGPAGMVGLLIAGLLTLGIGVVLVREFASE